MRAYSCGWGNPLSARQCRRCGAGLYYPTEETARLQKKAKAFLIIGLVLVGAGGYRGNLHDSPYDPDRNGSQYWRASLVTWALFT